MILVPINGGLTWDECLGFVLGFFFCIFGSKFYNNNNYENYMHMHCNHIISLFLP